MSINYWMEAMKRVIRSTWLTGLVLTSGPAGFPIDGDFPWLSNTFHCIFSVIPWFDEFCSKILTLNDMNASLICPKVTPTVTGWTLWAVLLLILNGLPAEHMVQKHLSIGRDGGSPKRTAQQRYSTLYTGLYRFDKDRSSQAKLVCYEHISGGDL